MMAMVCVWSWKSAERRRKRGVEGVEWPVAGFHGDHILTIGAGFPKQSAHHCQWKLDIVRHVIFQMLHTARVLDSKKIYVGASSVKVISCQAISRCVPALSAAPGVQLAHWAMPSKYNMEPSSLWSITPPPPPSPPPPALDLLYITVCKRGSLLPAVHSSDFKLTQHVQLPPPAVLLLPSRHGFAQPNLSNPVTPTHVRYTRCHATLPVRRTV